MQPTPSLLDWIKFLLGQPLSQRVVRFGLAGLAAVVGALGLLSAGGPRFSGILWLVLALALFVGALRVRGSNSPSPYLPGLSLGTRASAGAQGLAMPAVEAAALNREEVARLVRGLRLPSALVIAAAGQAALIYIPASFPIGVVLLALGAALFLGIAWHDGLLGAVRAPDEAREPAAVTGLNIRGWLLAVGVLAGAYGFWAAGDNTFRPLGVLAWIVSVAAWTAGLWEWKRSPREWLALAGQRLAWLARADQLSLRVTRLGAAFVLVLLVGAYFRFAQLNSIPAEMTSDHVEKLFDVNDVVNGKRPVFFERNTGREPLQFYFAAFLVEVFKTGVSHLTLKITGAVAGFLMLPFMYLLGRELEDRVLGLLAMLLAGFSFWATAISRVGLRFPLAPLFVAPALYFVLRGVRRRSRNDFLLAGLFMGAGLYGYSTFRVMPLAAAALAAWFWLWPQSWPSRQRLAANTILMFATTFIVFLPLYRYAVQPGNIFWYRTATRLGSLEQPIEGSPLAIFLNNNWNGLRMFNWLGDQVWVNTLPGKPLLDFITGALFVCGVVFLLARLVLRRDRVAGALLLLIPVLILPSTLSLAFPDENPSSVRAGSAIPVVILVAAYAAWLIYRRLRQVWPESVGGRISLVVLGVMLASAALVNRDMYFYKYAASYLGGSQNASEIGVVVHDFARSFGSYDRAWMCLHAYWADTRAVGIYAGDVGWEQVMAPEEFSKLEGDPQALLVILNPQGADCLSALRADFPTGQLSVVHSARGPDRDFLVFFVPAKAEVR